MRLAGEHRHAEAEVFDMLNSVGWQVKVTCVGTLQLLRHTEAQPVSSRYLHLHATSPTEHATQSMSMQQ